MGKASTLNPKTLKPLAEALVLQSQAQAMSIQSNRWQTRDESVNTRS